MYASSSLRSSRADLISAAIPDELKAIDRLE